MNTYRSTEDHSGVCEHARCEWVGPAICVVLGLLAACWLTSVLP